MNSALLYCWSINNRVTQVAEYAGANLTTDGGSNAGFVFIMGGTGAVPETMETELVKAGVPENKIKRFQGANRYETNLEVLKFYSSAIGEQLEYVMVCSGKDYADALSASAFGEPILLVGDKLTDAQRAFIEENGIVYVDIAGGEAAVSAEIEAELKVYAPGDDGVWRFGGSNRYGTSKALAEYGLEYGDFESDNIVLAYGMNYPDGLSCAPICFMNSAPLLLATTSAVGSASEYAHAVGVKYAFVMGGTTLISDAAALSTVQ